MPGVDSRKNIANWHSWPPPPSPALAAATHSTLTPSQQLVYIFTELLNSAPPRALMGRLYIMLATVAVY